MNRRRTIRQPIFLAATVCIACVGVSILVGCATIAADQTSIPPTESSISSDTEVALLQRSIAEGARDLVGARRLSVDGRTFRSDCSGTILAAYWSAGIDLERDFNEAQGNGVARLHTIARRYGSMRAQIVGDAPALGDVIFWDDTYDANADGRWNDPLTHAGIVVATFPNGRIDYVHYHYRRGIVVETMNLTAPNDVVHNAPMRMRGQRAPRRDLWLASHLFREAGSPYLLAID